MRVPIGGQCDARFSAVREAFAANFEDLDEVGAALCVRMGDRILVDLWGGYKDAERTQPWRADTLVNAYSIGKGILALLVLAHVERGDLRIDMRVSDVWPEFSAADKGDTTLRELLTHRAGLPAVRRRLPEGAMLDWDLMCEALASQSPWWKSGTAHGYHVNTFGYLVGEVLRRATGRSVGEALHRGLTGPLGADFHYGLPVERHRDVAHVIGPDFILDSEEKWALAFPATGDTEHDTMVWHSYFNPSGLSGFGAVNTAPWRLATIPSTNGHGTARAVAALYALALADRAPGPSAALLQEATEIHSDGLDRVLGRATRFGLGFQLATPERPIGRSPRAFGHFGYGGSLGFADPDAGLAFGYLMNRPGERWKTPRAQRLIDAVYGCLGSPV